MDAQLDHTLIDEINQNIGIAHKICNIYFLASNEREDVFQEMMYQLCRAYPSFQQKSKFSTWMYRVCLNTALTCLKKDKRNKNESLSVVHHQIANETDKQQNNQIQILYQAIESLSSVNKAIILLFLEDISYEEIADITGLSKSNVSVRLVRIKKDLEIQLRKQLNTTEDARY